MEDWEQEMGNGERVGIRAKKEGRYPAPCMFCEI